MRSSQKELEKNQFSLYNEINEHGLNLVSCGNCSAVIIHRINSDLEYIQCFACLSVMDICDCPDYWYETHCEEIQEDDLFDNYNSLPEDVKAIIDSYSSIDSMSYQDCENMLQEMEEIGYTFKYSLDAMPYGLKKKEV